MGYIEIVKEYNELKRLNRARQKFYKTVKYLEGEVVYSPPKRLSWAWIMDYKYLTVEEDTETKCYESMQKELARLINYKINMGEMTV